MNYVPNLMNRNGHYYFRYMVPKSAKKVLNFSEITYSLKTKEYHEAKVLCGRILNMTHLLINQLVSNPKFIQTVTLEPQKAMTISKRYLRDCIKREIRLFELADMHAKYIQAEGVPATLTNRQAYLDDPLRTAKRRDFLYPDLHWPDFFLYDDRTIEQKEDRDRIYEVVRRQHQLELPRHSQSERTFQKWMDRAIDAGLHMHNQRLNDEAFIKSPDPCFDYDELVSDKQLIPQLGDFASITGQYLAEFRLSTRNPKSVMKKQAAFALWLEFFNNAPVITIDKACASKFKTVLMKMPKHFTKKYRGKKVTEVDLDAVPQEQRLDLSSVNGYLMEMTVFVNWAKQHGHFSGENPFSGLSLKVKKRSKDTRQPFNEEQIKSIFGLPLFTGCKSDTQFGRYQPGERIIWDSYYWVPLIALYTGARSQEICQLQLEDIKALKNRHYFDFNDEGEGQHLKTENSRRKCPIHSELIRLGFLDFVEHTRKKGGVELFPDIPIGAGERKSSVYSKRFRTTRKNAGVTGGKVCFHSFRHTVIDAFRNAGVPSYFAKAITGHSEGPATTHDGYGAGPKIEALFAAIEKLRFPLNLPRQTKH